MIVVQEKELRHEAICKDLVEGKELKDEKICKKGRCAALGGGLLHPAALASAAASWP
jgi:hypothetical protein